MRSTSSEVIFPIRRYFWDRPGGFSEHELEDLLKEETRKLPMPSGEWKPFTHFKLTWDTMDYLMIMAQGKYSRVMLVDLALKQHAQNGKAFMDCFADVCAYHADLLDRKLFPKNYL